MADRPAECSERQAGDDMQLVGLFADALRVYILVFIIRAIFSWLAPQHRDNEVYRFLVAITDPVLRPIRRILPSTGGIDFSPLVAIVLLEVLRGFLVRSGR